LFNGLTKVSEFEEILNNASIIESMLTNGTDAVEINRIIQSGLKLTASKHYQVAEIIENITNANKICEADYQVINKVINSEEGRSIITNLGNKVKAAASSPACNNITTALNSLTVGPIDLKDKQYDLKSDIATLEELVNKCVAFTENEKIKITNHLTKVELKNITVENPEVKDIVLLTTKATTLSELRRKKLTNPLPPIPQQLQLHK